ncbi:MAG: hypothetical protein J6T01_00675 [Kiritimatiellae bacterium]|nr:hypothetical protein [Kiritimatiellia bacterium]
MTRGGPEETGAKMDALGLWGMLEQYNFAVKPRGTAFPYFCSVLRGERRPVKVRFLMLEGWQTMHDYIRWRADRFFGFYTTPAEMPHLEMVVFEDGRVSIFRHDPGYVPAAAAAAGRKIAAAVLGEASGVMLRIEADRALPMRFAADKAVFARVERADGEWEDAPLEIPDPPPHTEKVEFPEELVKKAQDMPFDRGSALEVDLRLLLHVMTAEPRARSVYSLKGVDSATGETALDERASASPDGGLRDLWQAMPSRVLNALVLRGAVPGEIKCCSGRVFRLLRPLCMELPFKLSLHDRLDALDAAYKTEAASKRDL